MKSTAFRKTIAKNILKMVDVYVRKNKLSEPSIIVLHMALNISKTQNKFFKRK